MFIIGDLFFFDAYNRCEKKTMSRKTYIEIAEKMPTLEAATVQSRYLVSQRLGRLIGCYSISSCWHTLWESTPHPGLRT